MIYYKNYRLLQTMVQCQWSKLFSVPVQTRRRAVFSQHTRPVIVMFLNEHRVHIDKTLSGDIQDSQTLTCFVISLWTRPCNKNPSGIDTHTRCCSLTHIVSHPISRNGDVFDRNLACYVMRTYSQCTRPTLLKM